MARSVFYFRPGHPKASAYGMVDSRDLDEYEAPRALDAPIMVDRFYENTRVVGTGEDIGSRQKHREYMRRNNLTTIDDFKDTWAKAEKERQNYRAGIMPDARERRNEVGRILYEVEKKHAKRRG